MIDMTKKSFGSLVWGLILCIFTASLVCQESLGLYNITLGITILGIIVESVCCRQWIWPNKWIVLFISFYFVTLLISMGVHFSSLTVKSTISYITWSLPFWPLFYWGRKTIYRQWLVGGFGIGLIIMLVHAWILGPMSEYGMRFGGAFYQPNLMAYVLETVTPLFILLFIQEIQKKNYKISSFLLLISAFSGCFTLVLTQSRGALIGWGVAIVAIMALLTYKWIHVKRIKMNKWLLGLIILFILLFGWSFNQFGNMHWHRPYDFERILLWQSSIQMWFNNPWFGIGMGNWHSEYLAYYISPLAKEPNLTHSHNIILYIMDMTGLLGLIGFLVFFFGSVIIYCKKYLKYKNIYLLISLWALISITAHGMVDLAMLSRFGMYPTFAIMGLSLGAIRIE